MRDLRSWHNALSADAFHDARAKYVGERADRIEATIRKAQQ
jgi:hypothetical protein